MKTSPKVPEDYQSLRAQLNEKFHQDEIGASPEELAKLDAKYRKDLAELKARFR